MLKVEIEGTDGAGKTTGLKYLIEKLQGLDQKVLETREVGSPLIPINVKLREVVLSPESDLSGKAMELIFSAMRLENERYYRKVGHEYDFIVSDRGWFSHLAYTDHNVDEFFTQKLYISFLSQITTLPDVVIYFEVNTDTALKRRISRGEGMDVIEQKGVPFQDKVRSSFEKYLLYASEGIKVIRIDANQSLENVKKQIDDSVETLLSLKK